jgi:hypothetical protein
MCINARLNQNGRPAATIVGQVAEWRNNGRLMRPLDCLSSSPINPILKLQVNPVLKLQVSKLLSLNPC